MKIFDAYCYRPQTGALLLRWSLAILMLFHGWAKLQNGTAGIEGMLAKVGLPAFFAYGVYLGEIVAPLMLLAGVFVVPAALVVAFNMAVAVLLAHSTQFTQLTKSGGWQLELQAFFFITALVVALTTPCKKS